MDRGVEYVGYASKKVVNRDTLDENLGNEIEIMFKTK